MRVQRLVTVALVGQFLRACEEAHSVFPDRRLELLGGVTSSTNVVQKARLILKRVFHALFGRRKKHDDSDGESREISTPRRRPKGVLDPH